MNSHAVSLSQGKLQSDWGTGPGKRVMGLGCSSERVYSVQTSIYLIASGVIEWYLGVVRQQCEGRRRRLPIYQIDKPRSHLGLPCGGILADLARPCSNRGGAVFALLEPMLGGV